MKLWITPMLVLFLTTPLLAQQESLPTTRWEMIKIDGRNTFKGITHVYSRPAHWQQRDWLIAGGVVAGTAGLFLLDERVQPTFSSWNDDVPQWVQDVGFYPGKPQYNYGFTTGVYALGVLTKNAKIRETGVLLIASATATGLIQTVSKTALGRARPSTGVGNRDFEFFNGTPDYHSFPSGHAVLMVTTAYAIGKQVDNPWLKAGIYTLGAITPISRLWTDAHWLSDVGLSSALSIIVVDSVANYLRKQKTYHPTDQRTTISWRPSITPTGVGLVGVF